MKTKVGFSEPDTPHHTITEAPPRYGVVGNWRTYQVCGHGIVLEVSDTVDTRLDARGCRHHYVAGALRVRVPGRAAKIFTGERAWYRAERYAHARALALAGRVL